MDGRSLSIYRALRIAPPPLLFTIFILVFQPLILNVTIEICELLPSCPKM